MSRSILCFAIAALVLSPATRAAAEGSADQAAAQQIAQDLKDSGQLHGYRVGVKYQDGVAWLMGTVTSPEQKRIAERVARKSKGVDRVISKLEIEQPQQESAEQFAADESSADSSLDEQPIQQASAPLMRAAGARPIARQAAGNMPMPYARSMQGVQQADYGDYCPPGAMGMAGGPPMGAPAGGAGYAPTGMGQAVSYDNPQMPGYAWPSYASYPNYAGVTYPQQYSPTAWPYIGPFYPYPQVPLGWRKVTLEWDDGWWFLDFKDCKDCR